MEDIKNEELQKAKKLINRFSNVKILPAKNLEKDSFLASLALFYSLKKLQKNVNLDCEFFPERFNFLIKKEQIQFSNADFLISIKEKETKLSQIFYEKTNKGVNLYLKTNGGELKKENIALTPLGSEVLLITVGIHSVKEVDFSREKEKFAILNIDYNKKNENFGDANLIEEGCCFSEIVFKFLDFLQRHEELFDRDVANCLLAGIIYGTHFFQDANITPDTFNVVAKLMEREGNLKYVISKLYQTQKPSVFRLLKRAFLKLKFLPEQNLVLLVLKKRDFKETLSSPKTLGIVLEKIILTSFPFQNFLCMWENELKTGHHSHALFYSPNNHTLEKISSYFPGERKGNAYFFQPSLKDIESFKEEILHFIVY